MLDYYYIDLYFDPEKAPFQKVVERFVYTLMAKGCTFQKAIMARPDTNQNIPFEEHVDLHPDDLPAMANAYVEEMMQDGQNLISFPPLGRIMFSYDFRFDDIMLDEIHEEEDDSRSSCDTLGLTFTLSLVPGQASRIKASLSLWEEYVLINGTPEVQAGNMRDIIGMITQIAQRTPPFFGAMDNEMHLNTDDSLALLMEGRLPEGNEFIVIGKPLMDKVDTDALKQKGYPVGPMPDGGIIIQMTDKWDGISAV